VTDSIFSLARDTVTSLWRSQLRDCSIATERWRVQTPRRITHVRTASNRRARQRQRIAYTANATEVAYQRTPIDRGYCELKVKIIHEIWYRRNFQNTRARISTARRFGDDWPTSIPRASAPPPGWSVGGRLEGWLVSTTRRLVLAPSHQQRRRRLKNNTHEQIRFSLFIPFVIFRNIMCYR